MSDQDKMEKSNEYKEYNEKLSKNQKTSNLNLVDLGEILGYINIPKINVYLPIYEGTSTDVLLQGIGHLENSSLPIGGISTNSILVGHSGIMSKTLFDNLDDLEIDDIIYIHILDKTLKYKVSDKYTILPDETDSIKIEKGKDIITLATCVPKYINTHRLIVKANRVEETNKLYVNSYEKKKKLDVVLLFVVEVFLLIIIIIVIRLISN